MADCKGLEIPNEQEAKQPVQETWEYTFVVEKHRIRFLIKFDRIEKQISRQMEFFKMLVNYFFLHSIEAY